VEGRGELIVRRTAEEGRVLATRIRVGIDGIVVFVLTGGRGGVNGHIVVCERAGSETF